MVNEAAGPSRRTFLGAAGAALAGAVVVGGCGSHPKTGRKAIANLSPQATANDLRILRHALELERRAVAAYTACIPLLGHRDAKAAQQFLGEELQQTGELLALIRAAGGPYPARAASYDIGHPRDGAEALVLLHSLESEQIGNYLRSIPMLSAGPVRAAVSSILTVDSQHVTMLRLVQGQVPVPSAFVTGAE